MAKWITRSKGAYLSGAQLSNGYGMDLASSNLQPTLKHLPVVEFITPEQFENLGRHARSLGFVHVASGPLVRSSYHADEFELARRG